MKPAEERSNCFSLVEIFDGNHLVSRKTTQSKDKKEARKEMKEWFKSGDRMTLS